MSRFTHSITVGLLLAASSIVQAQNGDKAGEKQESRVPAELIPPAPVLSPEESLKTFVVEPGFHIQLVAAEPLVQSPVAMQFDGDGRMWIVEMTGYMPNPEGKGEREPVGKIAILEDTDGDGRMDKRRVFADKLVMPRALSLVNGGLAVAEPPKLWFYPINKDLTAGPREEIANDYAKENDPERGPQSNPEHASNGLMWALDNWIYSANHTTRFRNTDGTWKREGTASRGQWGISQDNYGRLVYNSNSDQYRMDLVPSAYLARNPNLRSPAGLNVDPIRNQLTYPIRVNPGVNRGYQPGTLRDDGKLYKFTAASGPVIYRGDNFPADYQGNAFVPEPSANLIKRNILADDDGVVTGKQAWDGKEFLASTEERFRPVNLYNGPDGALYIVDFHRGLIQHRIYLTSYLRGQTESRNLQAPVDMGRIYRVVHGSPAKSAAPKLETASQAERIAALSSPNGWTRDTAQRLLVTSQDEDLGAQLARVVKSGESPLGRLHALWTLEGLNQLDAGTVLAAMSDKDPKVRAAGIRVSEVLIRLGQTAEFLPRLVAMAADTHGDVQLQLALTLGTLHEPEAMQAMIRIARQSADNPVVRDALLSGLWKREAGFLETFLADKSVKQSKAASEMIAGLARCVMVEAKAPSVGRMFDLLAKSAEWQQDTALAALADVAAKSRSSKRVVFAEEPKAFRAFETSTRGKVKEHAAKIAGLITWPGQPGYVPPPVVPPLTETEMARFEQGKTLYLSTCGACHQLNGLGMDGLAPPLAESEWVNGPAERLIRIVLHGVRGPIEVGGRRYEMEMPGLGAMEDAQLAAMITYVRREWDNTGSPVTPEMIATERSRTAGQTEAWTAAELMKVGGK
jgi:mono/diheme cytochrome c family protein/glucose/arabinose dehydrogenase